MCNAASIADDTKGMLEIAQPLFTGNELNDMLHYIICTGPTHGDEIMCNIFVVSFLYDLLGFCITRCLLVTFVTSTFCVHYRTKLITNTITNASTFSSPTVSRNYSDICPIEIDAKINTRCTHANAIVSDKLWRINGFAGMRTTSVECLSSVTSVLPKYDIQTTIFTKIGVRTSVFARRCSDSIVSREQ